MQKQILPMLKMLKLLLGASVFAFSCNVNAQMFESESDSDSYTQQENVVQQPQRQVNPRARMQNNLIKKTVKAQDVTVKKLKESEVVAPAGSIKLYMKDFKIGYDLHSNVSCNMTFYIHSDLKQKINNIAYRLKWPKMETAISFSNVEPNKETFVEYGLLGKGCYEMDVAPNIIVNRCRVKGLTQKKCSSMIQWVN